MAKATGKRKAAAAGNAKAGNGAATPPGAAMDAGAPALPPLAFPVICLGASAGGLKAYSDFFEKMPDGSGMAFVLVNHVDPDHESLMPALVGKHTAMPVVLARDGAKVEPDHVYVIPPNHFLSIEEGVFRLSEPSMPRGLRLPIDYFLRSLATCQKQNAVAVILSGTGSDGSAGIAEIKDNGGIVLVQDPREATQAGMPRSAMATDCVDHILPVAAMPKVLLEYGQHPYIKHRKSRENLGERARGSLAEIINALKAYSPINFELYKEGTLLRRIERRMILRHMVNTTDYVALLKDSPDEAEKLCNDFLINVTSFFRDPDAFSYLDKEVLQELVRSHEPNRPVRLWVPACATGEEAYSLAMMLIERISAQRKDIKLQVFASDVDERSLSVARDGIYPDSIEEAVSPARLSRFFVKEDHTYRVTSELRDCVVFAHQNLLADAPFSKLDLISCRNLLIYLNADAQDRALQMFHFALNDSGYLFLGSSETAGGHEEFFQPKSKKFHVYKKIGKARHRPTDYSFAPRVMGGAAGGRSRPADLTYVNRLADLSQRLLIERYAPAAVLINSKLETIYVEGPADDYLKVPTGEASQSVLAMARPGLRAKLATTIRTALQSGTDVTTMGMATRDGQRMPVRITAHPFEVDEANLCLVTFEDQPAIIAGAALVENETSAAARSQLEQELETTRLDLQNTIRDFERSTEELKAANEEAMSMNEEFQSTNEELETSKEELQSLNEELTTLNTQLQQKVEDERRMADDLNNLLSSSGVATLFLDREMNIMRFTPTARELFNVISNDVGRPFGDITSKIDDPALLEEAKATLETLAVKEREVCSKGGKWFIRRVLPYRTQDSKINGVVITFAEVTDLKKLQEEIRAAQRFAEDIVSTIREPMLVLDAKLHIVSASRSFHAVFGAAPEKIVGASLFDLDDKRWDLPELRRLLMAILPEKNTVEAYEVSAEAGQAGPRHMLLNARQLKRKGDGDDLILLAIEDVTKQKEAQQELLDREARLAAILDSAPEAIVTIDTEGTVGSFSPAAESMFGYPAGEIVGRNIRMLMPEPDRSRHDGYLKHYLETGEKKIIGVGREMDGLRKDGTVIPIRLTVAELQVDGQRHFLGMMHDLTDDRARRQQLLRAQKMEAVGQLTGGLAHDFNNLLTVIIGNLELMEMRIQDERLRELLNEALQASNIGASLTNQLLSFAKSQTLKPEKVNLNELVGNVHPLLVRTLGEKIAIDTQLSPDIDSTVADAGQIESAILNMAINARDAMPDGGTLTIETRNAVLDEDYARTQLDLKPGHYVQLSVTDTGEGMTPEVLNQAFEPFFTTKPPGSGSGLGLSMIYGFAKQSGGHVAIYSEVGKGTTVNLYLPSTKWPDVPKAEPAPKESHEAGQGKILVVEDERQVRRLTVTRLEELGYKVIAASNGPEAIELLKAHDDIDLVLSDIVMPMGMSGFEVARRAIEIKPGLKILFATGYSKGAGTEDGNVNPLRHPILRKPYSLDDLSKALRDLLQGPAGTDPDGGG